MTTRKPSRDLAVTIQALSGRDGEYLAYFRSEPLDATFSLYFRDSLMGAIAVHQFAEMLRKSYGVDGVRLELCDQALVFRSPAVLDVLTAKASGRNGGPLQRGV